MKTVPRLSMKPLAVSLMLAIASNAWALPVGGVVSAGSATIAATPGQLTVGQTTQNAAINWQSFSIGQGEAVRFVQPNSSSVALNRVLGSDPSSILGSLSANGQVFLVNPNGILFGRGAQVNVGGLVASTLNISDADFMAGQYRFSGTGNGTVVNQGSISADGGYVALLGASVSNQGTIVANLGTVVLAAGSAMTLDMAGDGLLSVTVDKGAVDALVENGGLIRANGGQVVLTTQAAGNLLKTVVNNTGIIEAQALENRAGTIRLLGDMQTGTVNVGGTLDASAPVGGNGGFIETSAARVNVEDGARVTTAAPQGVTGTWLIDPVDYTIAPTTGDITGAQLSANLATSNVTILSTSGAVGVGGNVNVADVVTWSANKLTLNAQNNININSPMNGSGTASLSLLYGQAAVAAGNTSTYNVLAAVNLPAGNNFTTQLGSNGVPTNYTVITSLGAMGSATGTDLQGMSGNLAGHYALGANIDAAPTAAWNAGAGFDPVGQTIVNPFTGNFDGLGHTITGLTIFRPVTNNVGLFGYAVSAANAQLKNVAMTGGSVEGGLYVGSLVGHDNGDISNVHVSQPVTGNGAPDTYVGDVAGWVTGNIANSSATGGVNHSGSYSGGLVGWITGNITCCSATGAVAGAGLYSGGLAGWVSGNVSRSFATGNVATTGMFAGGLLGWVTGNTSNSYATGSVTTAGINVGGLIGWNDGLVSNSYSSGAVAGAAPVGGLIGFMNGGAVTNSFWDITTSGQGLSAGGAGVKGMPTLDMKQLVNFTSATPANAPLSPSWDFANTWTIVNGVTDPTLLACLAPVVWTAVPQVAVIPPLFVPVPIAIVPPAAIPALVAPILLAPAVVEPVVVASLPLPSIRFVAAEVPEELGNLKLSLVNGGLTMPPVLVLAEPVAAPVRAAAPAPALVRVQPPVPPRPIFAAPPPRPVIAPPVRPRRQDRN